MNNITDEQLAKLSDSFIEAFKRTPYYTEASTLNAAAIVQVLRRAADGLVAGYSIFTCVAVNHAACSLQCHGVYTWYVREIAPIVVEMLADIASIDTRIRVRVYLLRALATFIERFLAETNHE